jgi:hypothetical protein
MALIEWLYWLRSAKLCAVHNLRSGPPSGAKKKFRFCGFTQLQEVFPKLSVDSKRFPHGVMNSDSPIFCIGKENMNSYEENKKRKDGAQIQFCAVFVLCAKMA